MDLTNSFWTNAEFWKFIVNNGISLLFCVFLGFIILRYLPILSKIQLLMIQLLEGNRATSEVIKSNTDIIKECSVVIKDNCDVLREVKAKM
jgi:hypothetical protein